VTLKPMCSAWKAGYVVDANPGWMKYQQDVSRFFGDPAMEAGGSDGPRREDVARR
jgi:hypothetical protein